MGAQRTLLGYRLKSQDTPQGQEALDDIQRLTHNIILYDQQCCKRALVLPLACKSAQGAPFRDPELGRESAAGNIRFGGEGVSGG